METKDLLKFNAKANKVNQKIMLDMPGNPTLSLNVIRMYAESLRKYTKPYMAKAN